MAQNDRTTNEGSDDRRAGAQREETKKEAREAMQPRGGGGSGMARERRGAGSPFSFVQRMMEDMDRLFGEFGVGGGLAPMGGALGRGWQPALEVFEDQGQLVVRADLPGMRPEDVNLELRDDLLIISGERRDEKDEEREGWRHTELSYGRFERMVRVPRGLDPATAEAKFENGVLEVKLPMPEEKTKQRSIPIQGGAKAQPPKGAGKAS
jgi:HSP20 family protein